MRSHSIAFLACLAGAFWSASSYAVVVNIDTFAAHGTSSLGAGGFTDYFADGAPPPCGPGARKRVAFCPRCHWLCIAH